MKQHCSQEHLDQRLIRAKATGYYQRFHLFKSAQMLSLPSKKIFDFEELLDPDKEDPCLLCGDTILYVTTYDGSQGVILKPIEE